MKNARLVLLRHGESLYNQQNRFTGWSDVELSKQGKAEAKEAGKLLKQHKIYPDLCCTSWLKRAIHTAEIALNVLEWEQIDSLRSYALNERHYGAWQGRDKDEVREEEGEITFQAVRRGYDTPPPILQKDDQRAPWREAKYREVSKALLPLSESLHDTRKRVVYYFESVIQKVLLEKKTVLISAHGNSLRALVMYLEKMDKEDVASLEIPTGELIIYTFDAMLNITAKERLHTGDLLE
jgi:2,3-bisphosphoglycerate-dependent phosphoglycerate mutase